MLRQCSLATRHAPVLGRRGVARSMPVSTSWGERHCASVAPRHSYEAESGSRHAGYGAGQGEVPDFGAERGSMTRWAAARTATGEPSFAAEARPCDGHAQLALVQEDLSAYLDREWGDPYTYAPRDPLDFDAAGDLRQLQLDVEQRAIQHTVAEYESHLADMRKIGRATSQRPAQLLMLQWYEPLVRGIQRQQQQQRQQQDVEPTMARLAPFLRDMDPRVLAVITMHEALRVALREVEGARFGPLALEVGRAVQQEAVYRGMARSQALDLLQGHTLSRAERRRAQRAHAEADGIGGEDEPLHHAMGVAVYNASGRSMSHEEARAAARKANWPPALAAQVGALLLKLLIDTAVVTDSSGREVPAFQHALHRASRGRAVGVMTTNGAVLEMLGTSTHSALTYHQHDPMVVRPRDWTAHNRGAYLATPCNVMRTKSHGEQTRVLGHASMSRMFTGLNALGAVPWRINEPVLQVQEAVWAIGGGMGDIPKRTDVPLPEEPGAEAGEDERKAFYRSLRRARTHNSNLHSLRCDLMYKLATARRFLRAPELFFPHNVDFRGRAYPMPPHLNHMGNDACRGLLRFRDARPLGRSGLRWLKIHLANLFGVDKVPFADRAAYVDEHMEQVIESAERPLEGTRWWLGADDPWQALAACFELAAAVRSGDPESFLSSLPIHQDGSCNGLQHYAALGKDELGAQQVNLLPSDRPQDVYSGVLDLVKEKLAVDAARTEFADERQEEDAWLAGALVGVVNRKVVKQTVMTSVYGVTFVGARKQIQNRLEDLMDEGAPLEQFPEEKVYRAAAYLARLTLSSLGQLFSGATAIMKWLGDCSTLVAQQGQPMSWVTPLGLPVVQPYRRPRTLSAKSQLQSISLSSTKEALPVNVARQRSAFPPNYVHSLDSTHMLLTAIDCRELGLSFAAVHDSYWTHAATIEDMNASLRRQFVALHSQPLLEELNDQLRLRFPDIDFPDLPELGTFDLQRVMDSPYFFS